MPLSKIGHEAEIAVQLGVQALDIGTYLGGKIPAGAEFVRLSATKVVETLDDIASMPGRSDCLLVYNFDLLLSGVRSDERQRIWQNLFNGFPNRSSVLLLTVPESATHLLPSDSLLERWQRDNRLI